jgi:hypothetical protein
MLINHRGCKVSKSYKKNAGALMLATFSGAAYAQTVNMNSDAYKTGHLVGQILAVIIVAVVIKKLFFSSKE